MPSHGNTKDETKAEKSVNKIDPEMIVKTNVKHDSQDKSKATETDPATNDVGRRLPIFCEEDEEEEGMDK